MIWFVLRRLGAGVVIFFSVTAISFALYYARGGAAIARGLLPKSDQTPQGIAYEVHSLGLDRPLVTQYWDWLRGLVVGDFGRSFTSRQPVSAIMADRIPVTLSLIVVTMLLMAVFGVLLGVLAAYRGGVVDRGVQILSVGLTAVPSYWLALILVIVFGLNLKLFPATGYIPLTESLGGWFSSIILPSMAIALGGIFSLAVWIRSSIIDMQRRDWVRTLRSRGISERAIMFRHVLRNAAAPTVQIFGLNIIGLIGGTIIVERIYALNGLGNLSITSGTAGDIPVVLGTVSFLVAVIVIVNLLVDIINGLLNPKARMA